MALATVTSWGHRVPRRLVFSLALIGTGLLVLRSVASLIQTGYFAVTGQFRLAALWPFEAWFYLGAILFSLSTWRSRQMRMG